jgi:bifunctional DNA-binding transcriptional regulator/antitoxin component of YhaV-PrlF toxin-antitoxin module
MGTSKSLYCLIPQNIRETLGWKQADIVNLQVKGKDKIVITKIGESKPKLFYGSAAARLKEIKEKRRKEMNDLLLDEKKFSELGKYIKQL